MHSLNPAGFCLDYGIHFSSWVDANGTAKTASVLSDTSMSLSPRVVAATDTWTGTVYWTVTLYDTTGASASNNFSVSR